MAAYASRLIILRSILFLDSSDVWVILRCLSLSLYRLCLSHVTYTGLFPHKEPYYICIHTYNRYTHTRTHTHTHTHIHVSLWITGLFFDLKKEAYPATFCCWDSHSTQPTKLFYVVKGWSIQWTGGVYNIRFWYGVATISRLLKIIGLFCKRTLYKRLYSAKETHNFKEPNNRSHPIYSCM